MLPNKDKQYNAIIWTSRQMGWPCLTRVQQLWPARPSWPARLTDATRATPVAYGWDENNIIWLKLTTL